MNVRPRLRLLAFAMLGCAAPCIALYGADAVAHAIVIAAQPAMNQTVPPGDVEIRLVFNSKIDARRSSLRLERPDGAVAPIVLGSDDGGGTLRGHVSAMLQGRWTVHWQVLSLDGHITRGDVIFFVR